MERVVVGECKASISKKCPRGRGSALTVKARLSTAGLQARRERGLTWLQEQACHSPPLQAP